MAIVATRCLHWAYLGDGDDHTFVGFYSQFKGLADEICFYLVAIEQQSVP